MHEMLCSAGQSVSRMMCGEACPADGSQTVPAMFGSWSDRPRSGTASSGIFFAGALARSSDVQFSP